MNAQLSTEQLIPRRTAVVVDSLTHCPWCSNVWSGSGDLVDPKPDQWAALPAVPCRLCARLEAMFRRVPKPLMPMTREELANAGIVRKGKKIISVRRTLESVSAGRSCLPVGDRD
jgi:hypothetical protein